MKGEVTQIAPQKPMFGYHIQVFDWTSVLTPLAHARTGCMIPYDKKRRLQRKIVGQVPKTAGSKTDSAKPKTPRKLACWSKGGIVGKA